MPKPSKAAMKDLPPNWEARNVKGRIVYINHTTRTTQWTKPKVNNNSKGGSKSQGASAVSSPARVPRVSPVDDFQGPRNATGGSPPPPVKQQGYDSRGGAKGGSPPTRLRQQEFGSRGGAPQSGSPLPPGWECKFMEGKMVYIDHINKTTTLRKPPSRPSARGAGQPSSDNRELAGPLPSSEENVERTRSSDSLRGPGIDAYGGNVRRRHASNPGPSSNRGSPDLGPSNHGPSKLGPSNHGPSNLGPSNHGPSNLGPSGPSNHGPSNHGPSYQGPSNHGPSYQGPSNHGPSAAITPRIDFEEALPTGWGRSVTPEGEVYYVNHLTKSTTWTRPRWTYAEEDADDIHDDESLHEDDPGGGPDGSVRSGRSGRSGRSSRSRGGSSRRFASGQEDLELPLPPGWEERMSAEGKVFYIDHNSKTTHWTRPDPPLALLPQEEDPLPLEEVVDHSSNVPRKHLDKPLHSDLTDMQADRTPFATAESGPRSLVPSPAPFDDPSAYTRPDSVGDPHAEVGTSAGAIDLAKNDPVVDDCNTDFTDTALEEVADVHPRGVYGSSSVGGGGGERAPSATVSAPAGATDRAVSGGGTLEGRDAREPSQAAQHAQKVPSLKSAEVLLLQSEMDVAAEERERGQEQEREREGEGEGEAAGGVSTGAAGPVSSIVKSGMFGSTVRARGGSIGGSGGGSSNGSASANHAAASSPAGAAATAVATAGAGAGAAAGPGAAAAASRGAGVGPVSEEDRGLGSGPPPLGLGWMELKTADGKVYYQNSILKITQWKRPDPDTESASDVKTAAAVSAAKEAGAGRGDGDEVEAEAAAAAELHTVSYNSSAVTSAARTAAEAGWEKVTTPDGRPYYQNMVTIETSWEKPPGWVDSEDEAEHEAAAAVATSRQGGPSLPGGGRNLSETTPVVQPEDATEVVEAPLPPGWEKLYTKEGVPFWTNHNERTTSWDPPSLPTPSPTPGSALPTGEVQSSLGQGQGHVVPGASPNSSKFESVDAPAGAIAVAAAAASGQEKRPSLGADGKPLPEGWEMQTTDQGVVYYVDHINKRTSWDPPLMSTGGMSVIASQLPDIPPAELVPDSADLYMGADLLNRFFSSWRGDTKGKSPLEAARNVIVTYLTGPGLKATKGRNGSCLQRFLYLSPTNKQLVWATRATSKGKLSKKGLSLHTVTELHYEKSAIRVEARGESASLTFKSTAVDTLTSEGATILLGVLLADMTGTMLQLEGVSGGSGSNYYPAAFVNDVLRVRQARRDSGTSAAVAVAVSHQGSQPAQGVEEVPVLVAEPVEEDVVAPSRQYEQQQQQQQQQKQQQEQQQQQQSAASNGVSALARRFEGQEPQRGAAKVAAEPAPAPAAMVSPQAAVSPAGSGGLKPAAVTASGVGESYMARIGNGASDWRNKNGLDRGADKPASIASTANTTTRGSPGGSTPSSLVETTVTVSISQKPEIAMSGEDEDEDMVPAGVDGGDETSGSYPKTEGKSTPATSLIVDGEALPAEGQAKPGYGSSLGAATAGLAPAALQEGSGAGKAEVGAAAEAEPVVMVEAAAEEAEGGGGEEEEDEETREYRRVLVEMLRPVKLEKYVDDFLRSEITLDILPLVERKDLESEVGITAAIPQLKIMKQIKKRFPDGV